MSSPNESPVLKIRMLSIPRIVRGQQNHGASFLDTSVFHYGKSPYIIVCHYHYFSLKRLIIVSFQNCDALVFIKQPSTAFAKFHHKTMCTMSTRCILIINGEQFTILFSESARYSIHLRKNITWSVRVFVVYGVFAKNNVT